MNQDTFNALMELSANIKQSTGDHLCAFVGGSLDGQSLVVSTAFFTCINVPAPLVGPIRQFNNTKIDRYGRKEFWIDVPEEGLRFKWFEYHYEGTLT